ncbi:MAG: C40 family peptidase [Bacteroidota bacterium]
MIVFILALTSCSSSRKHSYTSSKKTRTERVKKSRTKSVTRKTASVPNNSKRSKIVHTAKKYIGKSYVYGGKKPSTGFDCSGFTSHVFKNNGVDISGPSHQQARKGKKKSKDELQQGDLVFFGKDNKVSHVAIVAEVHRNKIEVIHSTSSRGVVIDDISSSDYWQKRYLFGRDVLN